MSKNVSISSTLFPIKMKALNILYEQVQPELNLNN